MICICCYAFFSDKSCLRDHLLTSSYVYYNNVLMAVHLHYKRLVFTVNLYLMILEHIRSWTMQCNQCFENIPKLATTGNNFNADLTHGFKSQETPSGIRHQI